MIDPNRHLVQLSWTKKRRGGGGGRDLCLRWRVKGLAVPADLVYLASYMVSFSCGKIHW